MISTRLGAIPEVVDAGRTGLLVERDDPEGLLRAMRLLADESSRRREMAAAARERFAARFTLAAFQTGLRAIYDEASSLTARAAA